MKINKNAAVSTLAFNNGQEINIRLPSRVDDATTKRQFGLEYNSTDMQEYLHEIPGAPYPCKNEALSLYQECFCLLQATRTGLKSEWTKESSRTTEIAGSHSARQDIMKRQEWLIKEVAGGA